MSSLKEKALAMHQENQGKLGVYSKVAVKNAADLSLAYSPGVAEPCLEIHASPEKVYDYTAKGNTVAVVSNGTAVLGLGRIGALASIPVMEGKAVLLKEFAGVDAFPICLDTTDAEKIVDMVATMAATFGGVNLEDIAAPDCFVIEEALKKRCDIPIFHDDQHGTAIVTAAGLINALKLANKQIEDTTVVINGAGAAGIAVGKLLLKMGIKDLLLCDRTGIIYEGRTEGMDPYKEEMARLTNREKRQGTLTDALVGTDVFIGLSVANCVSAEMVQTMNKDAIMFPMANPTPEIMPDVAKEAGAVTVGTGRSDFPNQINNVLAFPGIFRGALDARATEINEEMKIAAVYAIANLIKQEEIHADYVIPDPFDQRVVPAVAKAVFDAAVETGVARKVSCGSTLEKKIMR
ncbi:MAG: NAD-dependent malic enzyme [Defluviitaleaceae bacterium]|nr:NAD-dependent malic enzyme [Defluviitaleaceae bacterium]